MAGAPERESGFEVDGERYEIPTLDTITLDEERLLYVYADVVVSDFIPIHPDWGEDQAAAHALLQAQKIRNPDFKRALVHIAYRRRHDDVDDVEIQRLIGGSSALELDLAMIRGSDESPDPQTSSPNELETTSEPSELASNTDSGRPTGTSSGTPDSNRADIGTTESGISSPESLATASAS